MPMYFSYGPSYAERIKKKQCAEAAIRAKFPKLLEGSTGWHRALNNRMRRA
jgi:hypothetical protein